VNENNQKTSLFLKGGAKLMAFEDKTLKCRDCGVDFVFTSGEQEFYAQKGFENEPTRCADCRAKKKQQRNNQNRY
jgi:hypothetical protein